MFRLSEGLSQASILGGKATQIVSEPASVVFTGRQDNPGINLLQVGKRKRFRVQHVGKLRY
jgi:hypothetical protein